MVNYCSDYCFKENGTKNENSKTNLYKIIKYCSDYSFHINYAYNYLEKMDRIYKNGNTNLYKIVKYSSGYFFHIYMHN